MPGEGGYGHFNEQLREYWIKSLPTYNFLLNHKMTECLRNLSESQVENFMVFEKVSDIYE